jgi:signal transduction histidine kinase
VSERTVARPARWPWVLLASFVALAVVGTFLVESNGESVAEQVPFIVAFSMFGVVGALLVSRLPGNRIGALFLYGSFASALSYVCGEWLTYLWRHGTTEGPLVLGLAYANNLGWVIGTLPVLLLLPLLFPDGRPPSPRWRVLVWLVVGAMALLVVMVVLGSEVLTGSVDSVEIQNPLFVPAIGNATGPLSDAAFNLSLLGLLAASLTSLVMRFRRSHGAERQQIKWVALAVAYLIGALLLDALVVGFTSEGSLFDSLLIGSAFLALPVSVAVAVLQYHLYDLDLVVKKTLVAGVFAVLAILAYGAVVGLYALTGTEGASSGSVFVVALLLGLAFRPVTRFVRRFADRIVYGRRATPYEVLTEFSERMGEAYATQDVLSRMAQILAQGAGAESARVWLRVGRVLRPAASWPPGGPERRPVPADDDAFPSMPGETAVEVRDGGELLGALSVAMPARDPMTPAKERLVRDLASQAGLVLRNVGLVEELRASQRRLVAARDEERRRLERNIHDGAQQQLVALTVKMRLARALALKDGVKTAAMLEQMQAETQTALEDLRDLARGIYPPLLADQGLPAALDAQARKYALPIEVAPDGVTRYGPDVEAAVYFSILEALQNAAKYAEATRVAIRLGDQGGWLSFEVEDDGRGFEPELARHGTGLQGIADRLQALDGRFEVRSRLGEGTVVSGRVPLASPAIAP